MTLQKELLNALNPLCTQHRQLKKSIDLIKRSQIVDDQYFEVFWFILRAVFQDPTIMTNPKSKALRRLGKNCAEHILVLSEPQKKPIKHPK